MDELGLKGELWQKMGRGIDTTDRGLAGAKASGLSSWGCPEALPGLGHGKAGGGQIGSFSGSLFGQPSLSLRPGTACLLLQVLPVQISLASKRWLSGCLRL